jgi:SHS2 domain-containing protein
MADARTADDELAPGVWALDHTADLGVVVEAPTPEELFHRAGIGLMALLHEPLPALGPEEAAEHRSVALEAPDRAALLAEWLRTLLWAHDVQNRDYLGVRWRRFEATGLEAEVYLRPCTTPPLREIKAITYHELAVQPDRGGWRATVVVDV